MSASNEKRTRVFLSYASQDSSRVDELQEMLEASGIIVWRDRDEILPGQDWLSVIRGAVRDESIFFVPCFSSQSVLRDVSYQYEELLLAVEEYRKRPPTVPWIVPVRFADVELPEYDLGAGRRLRSLQYVDLFGADRSRNEERLRAVLRNVTGSDRDTGPPAAELDQSQRETFERLGRLPPYYSPLVAIKDLAKELRLAELADHQKLDEALRSDDLYSDLSPWGPSRPGLSTLRGSAAAIVLGNPGSGKSTLLAEHCRDTIARGSDFVIFARMEELGRIAVGRVIENETDALAAALIAWATWRGAKFDDRIASSWAGALLGRRLLLAADGLDEISSNAHREAALAVVERVRSSRRRILITSRITGYRAPIGDAAQFFVAPLSARAPERFVRKWFGEDRGVGFRSAIQALENGDLSSAARIPLIAGLICFVADREQVVAPTVPGLYRQYLSNVLRRPWKATVQQVTSLAQLTVASDAARFAAWRMATGDSDALAAPHWRDVARLDWLAMHAPSSAAVVNLFEEDGLLVSYGLASETDPLSQEVRWLHRTLHEHLVGRHMAQEFSRDRAAGTAWLVQAALRPQWSVAREHALHEISELGLAEDAFDRLCTAEDSADSSVVDYALQFALRSFDTSKSAAVALAAKRRRWSFLAEHDCDAFVDLADREYSTGMTYDELMGLCRAVRDTPLPPRWWDRFRMLGISNWEALRAMAVCDPNRSIDLLLRILEEDAPSPDYAFGLEQAARWANEQQANRIEAGVSRALASGDGRVIRWLDFAVKLPPRYRRRIEATLVGARIQSVVLEYFHANVRGRVPNPKRWLDADIADIAGGGFGNELAYQIGYDYAALDLSPTEGGDWFELGRWVGGTDWENRPPDPPLDRRSAIGALRTFAIGKSRDAETSRRWVRALSTVHQEPTVGLVTALFEPSLEPDSGGFHNRTSLKIDSAWWRSFINSVPLDIRLAALASLRDREDVSPRQRALIEREIWEAIGGLADARDPRHRDLFLSEIGTWWDLWDSFPEPHYRMFMLTLSKEPSETRQQVKTLLDLARGAGDKGKLEIVSVWAAEQLYSRDLLATPFAREVGLVTWPLEIGRGDEYARWNR